MARKAKVDSHFSDRARSQTLKFTNNINALVAEFPIDPVHQATLLMAKAIDVLAAAGPVPSTVEEQHKRSENLLQSVMRARGDLMEKSVRILYSGDIGQQFSAEDHLA